jgi:hypothetical protein
MSEQPKKPRHATADLTFATLIVLVSAFVVVYRALVASNLDRSVAMFVGVPMLLGVFAATRRPDGAVAATMKYTTLCLCVVAPLLGEGAVCLAMAAPIVYPVAALTAWLIKRKRDSRLRVVAAVPFVLALIGQRPPSELPLVTLTDSVDVDAPVDAVWRGIDRLTLPLDRELPLLLRAGFPRPVALVGRGVAVGSERRVVFDRGTVVARVVARDERGFTVELSYADVGHEFFDRWLKLEDAVFTIEPISDGRTRITHTTRYRRLLEPAFYFGPLEEAGVHQMHRFLFTAFAQALARSANRAERGEVLLDGLCPARMPAR